MITRLCFYVLIAVSGCSHYSKSQIQDEFINYVQSFNYEANQRGVTLDYTTITIRLAHPKVFGSAYTLAHCIPYPFHKLVEVQEVYWEFLTLEEREILIFHELGHCLLSYYTHSDRPDSIMAQELITGYHGRRKELIDEFFEGVKK